MIKASILFVILIAVARCTPAYAQDVERARSTDKKAVSEAFDAIRQLETRPYHHYLRNAGLILKPVCLGRKWSELTTVVDALECPIVDTWGYPFDYSHRHYLVQKEAVTFESGQTLDAHLKLSARRLERPKGMPWEGKIYSADLVLVAKIGVPYNEAIAQRRFPAESVLDVVLNSEEVKQEATRWPLVKDISVAYTRIMNKSGNLIYSASGFDVEVEFTASLEEDVGRKRMYLFVGSGLDPVKVYSDETDQPNKFTAKDTLKDVASHGSNESWSGEAAVIEANKKKYLKE